MQNTLTSPLAVELGCAVFDSSPHSFPALVLMDFCCRSSILGQREQNILCPPAVPLSCDGKGERTSPAWHFLAPVVPWWQGLPFWGLGCREGPSGVTQQHCQFWFRNYLPRDQHLLRQGRVRLFIAAMLKLLL